MSYRPQGIEQIALIAEEPWSGCPNVPLSSIEGLGIDKEDTFAHFWPSETDFPMYSHLDARRGEGNHQAVMVFGGISSPTGLESRWKDGPWSNIGARAIAFDRGDTWWAAVFDRLAGDLILLRRKPVQSMLRYNLFDNIRPPK